MRFWENCILFILIVYGLGCIRGLLCSCVFRFYSYFTHITFSVYIAAWILQLSKEILFKNKINIRNKAVLITGCDTGFGNLLARKFDKKGITVFACCLDPNNDGSKALKEATSNKLHIVRLDVTSDESVQNALDIVSNSLGNEKLWAIVNNAGILRGFQAEMSLVKDYEDCLQVNVLGMVRVTKTFLPLLRESKGRIINICSQAGRICCPFIGAYAMSKYAAVAYTETLMYELKEFGIRVISVEPELFKTPLCTADYLDKTFESSIKEVPEEVKAAYGIRYIVSVKNYVISIFTSASPKLELVLNAVEDAIILKEPADVYKPARNMWFKFLFFMSERVPRELYDVFYIGFCYALGVKRAKTGVNNYSKLGSL